MKHILWLATACLLSFAVLQNTHNNIEGKNRYEHENRYEGKNRYEYKNRYKGKNRYEEHKEEKTIDESPHNDKCNCLFQRSDTDFFLAKDYEKNIARLNASTLEVLESSHPNLPASFLHQRGLTGGCHLLPSQFG